MKQLLLGIGLILSLSSCVKEELEPVCPYGSMNITSATCVNDMYVYQFEAEIIDDDISWPTNNCLPALPTSNDYLYVYEVTVHYLPDPTGGIDMIYVADDPFWLFTNRDATGWTYFDFDTNDLLVKQ